MKSNRKILALGLLLAGTTALSAFAAQDQQQNKAVTPSYTAEEAKEGIKEGYKETKEGVKDGWNATANAAEDAYEGIKQFVTEETEAKQDVDYVLVNQYHTATEIIGRNVVNDQGQKLAEVEDIILDRDGDIQMLILSDGGFMGLGDRLVGINYRDMRADNNSGDFLVPVSKADYKRFSAFSYKQSDAESGMTVMPVTSISVAKLMQGELLDQTGNEVAEVENVTFSYGAANHLVVSYDSALGLGGKQAAMPFGKLAVEKHGQSIDVAMNTKQAEAFGMYKDVVNK